jgi:hypothetical protein
MPRGWPLGELDARHPQGRRDADGRRRGRRGQRVTEVIITALTAADGHSLPGHKVSKAVAGRDKHLVPNALDYLEIDGRIEVQNFEYHGRPAVKVTLVDDEEQTN